MKLRWELEDLSMRIPIHISAWKMSSSSHACKLSDDSTAVIVSTDSLFAISDFFDFSPEFPADKLFVRNADGNPLRSVYLSSDMVRTILEHNDYTRLRLISCGVKILVRQDPGKTDTYRCRWRITQDGLPVLKDYMGPARKMTGDLTALRKLCTDLYPTMEAFEDGDFKSAVKTMENGSLICEFLPGNQAGGKLETSIVLPLWRAPNSVCLMVEKMEKKYVMKTPC
jgi:multisite-specific tRNA:(cytosine-C5)-methyltransferase